MHKLCPVCKEAFHFKRTKEQCVLYDALSECAIMILPHFVWMLLQMVLETKSGLEGAVIGGGHSVAAARLDAQRSVAGWVSEQMGGLSYLFYIRDLVSHSHLHLES